MVSEKNQSKHVCVIRVGPSGLVAVGELRNEGGPPCGADGAKP